MRFQVVCLVVFQLFFSLIVSSSSWTPNSRFTGLKRKENSRIQPIQRSSQDDLPLSSYAYAARRAIDYSACATPSINSGHLVSCLVDSLRKCVLVAITRPSLALVGATVGALLLCQKDSSMATVRMCRTLGTVSAICLDYRSITAKLENYEEELNECHVRSADRLTKLLSNQGGLYIKAGQHLASMDHVLPSPFIRRLSELQDKARPMSIADVDKVFRLEFGKNLTQIFSEFSTEPIGVASIGQVHVGVLRENGQKVAVKVQHLNVDRESVSDLKTLAYAGKVIECFFPHIRTGSFVKQVQSGISNELDFCKEAENLKWAKECLAQSKVASRVHVPKVYPALSAKHVLTMEFCPGIKIDNRKALLKAGINPYDIDVLMYTVFSELIFRFNRVHCDPHPGNLLVSPDGKLIILDHGLYHEIDPETVNNFSELWLALLDEDEARLRSFAQKNQMHGKLTEYLVSALKSLKEEIKKGTPVPEIVKKFQSNLPDAETQKLLYEALNSLPAEILHVIKVYELLAANERKLLGGPMKRKPSLLVTTKYAHLKETNYCVIFKYRLKLLFASIFFDF